MAVALRLQQLAAGWLIHAYNGQAAHDVDFIDSSAWPIDSVEFDGEQLGVRGALKAADEEASSALTGIPHDYKLPGLSLAIVTVCSYPPGNQLPKLATSIHKMYAARHGYEYIVRRELYGDNRPPAWAKIRAMQDVMREGRHDWVLWVDCDLWFMNLTTTGSGGPGL